MKTYWLFLLLSALGAWISTPIVRRLAIRLGCLDLPDERKQHLAPTPLLGGVAVFIGFCLPWGGLYFVENRVSLIFQNYEKLFASAVLGAGCMLLVGAVDDWKGLKPRMKLLAQSVIALGLFLGGYRIELLSNPFGGTVELGWWSFPVSWLWIVGMTNALNLLDGLDGLATGVTACISMGLAIISIAQGQVIVTLLTLGLAGACLGFLPYNSTPARIFLGDCGSMFLGLILACIGMLSLFKAATATFILAPLLLFGLPLLDTTSVLIGRVVRRMPLFKADRTHLHHRLLGMGFSQRETTRGLYLFTLLLGLFSVILVLRQEVQPLSAAVCIAGGIWLLGRLFYRIRRRSQLHALSQPGPRASSPDDPT